MPEARRLPPVPPPVRLADRVDADLVADRLERVGRETAREQDHAVPRFQQVQERRCVGGRPHRCRLLAGDPGAAALPAHDPALHDVEHIGRRLDHIRGGDFEKMSRLMTGSAREARAARLRFNRLGLSARKEK